MKEVVHEFGVETDWVEGMAKAMGGYVKENYIIVPPEVHTGTRYTLSITPEITVMLADVTYHQDVTFKLRNSKDDFIGIYFNLAEGDSAHITEEVSRPMGRWNYNLAILESQIDLDYIVKAGTKTYNLCIFIKKSLLKEYLFNAGILRELLERIFDQEQNTILYYNIMSNNCLHLINEFQKKETDTLSFDLFLSSTVYNLLGDFLDQLVKRKIVICKLDNTDFSGIIASQEFLINKIEDSFPGITILARHACMSETKYKKMYKKITGLTPYEFFMNNKLELTRDLLASGQYNIGELADKLNFSNASNLTQLFKNYFGVLPKDYVTLI